MYFAIFCVVCRRPQGRRPQGAAVGNWWKLGPTVKTEKMEWLEELYADLKDFDITSLAVVPVINRRRVNKAYLELSKTRALLRLNHKPNGHKSRIKIRAVIKAYTDFLSVNKACQR